MNQWKTIIHKFIYPPVSVLGAFSVAVASALVFIFIMDFFYLHSVSISFRFVAHTFCASYPEWKKASDEVSVSQQLYDRYQI